MTDSAARRRSPLLGRVALVVALVVAITGTGTSAGWALWTATSGQRVEVTLGRTGASLTGATPRATTFADKGVPVVTSVTATNTGTVPASWTLTSTLPATSTAASKALAAAVDVQMWARTGATCGTTVPAGALTGTWAAPPAPSGRLGAAASVEWCLRTVATANAPAGASVAPVLALSLTSGGSWTAVSEIRDLTQRAPSTWPIPVVQATCISTDIYYARLHFDPSLRPPETFYAAYWGSTRIGAELYNSTYPEFTFTRDVLPSVPFGDAPIKVDIRVMDGGVPGAIAATGTVVPTVGPWGERNIQCS